MSDVTRRGVAVMDRPQRWDSPFDPDMSDADHEMLLQRPEFASVDTARFPKAMPFEGMLRNDARIVKFRAGDIIIREGDYGNSCFLLLGGDARIVIRPGLPSQVLGRSAQRRKSVFGAFAQLWRNRRTPETRDTRRYLERERIGGVTRTETVSLLNARGAAAIFKDGLPPSGPVERMPPLLDKYDTALVSSGAIFGEIAALARVPRTATIFAETDVAMLEMRWQGLRDIRKYDEGWRRIIDKSYRGNLLAEQLIEHPVFAGLSEPDLQKVADRTLFENYGSFEWFRAYKKDRQSAAGEPAVANEGEYADGLLVVASGFARVSIKVGNGRRTLTYLRGGDLFGLDELYTSWKSGIEVPLETSLTALGYLHVLRIPYNVLTEYVFPKMKAPTGRLRDAESRALTDDSLLEWAVDERFINGTEAMLINLDKCVRCDDCVRACAATHGGNPRFLRQGKVMAEWMVANACMHCVDPVCMIGCPTGAIHRTVRGSVVINDDTCIGCGTCANSCPYDNIRLVEICDNSGRPMHDPLTKMPILKATKCDLCSTQLGGPARMTRCAGSISARARLFGTPRRLRTSPTRCHERGRSDHRARTPMGPLSGYLAGRARLVCSRGDSRRTGNSPPWRPGRRLRLLVVGRDAVPRSVQ